MVQLWVNLPARDKLAPPGYQDIADRQILRVELPDAAGLARLIAGPWNGARGPARTFTPLGIFDLRLSAGRAITAPVPEGHTAIALLQRGRLSTGGQLLAAGELAIWQRSGRDVRLDCLEDSTVLMLTGEPLHEPVVGHGPFVMNTREEIVQAINDYQAGRMGELAD
jgi:hypothetical protein